MALITQSQSLTRGGIISAVVGLAGSLALCVASKLIFDVTQVAQIIFVPAWILIGYTMFRIGLFTVPFQMRAVRQWLGGKTDDEYTDGEHWRFRPFEKALVTPGPDQHFILEMEPTEPEGKDTVKILIGSKEKARIEIAVFSPLLYTATDDPEHTVLGSYGNQVRQLVNQMEFGLGLLGDKSLLEDYLELPPHPDHPIYPPGHLTRAQRAMLLNRHADIETRLRTLTIKRRNAGGDIEELPVYTGDSLRAVMNRAGRFIEELWENGMEPRKMLAPSIDPPPSIDAAAVEKEKQRHNNEVLALKVDAQRAQAKKLVDDLEVSGEDALDRIGLIEGQQVTRNIFGIPGLGKFLGIAAEAGSEYIQERRAARARNAQTPKP